MRAFILLLPVVLVVVCMPVLQADTILVPSQEPTIQAGIDAAVDGDTVLVADGTYTEDGNRDIDFLGKAIVVMSENGAENCIIDCGAIGRGFYFGSGEDSNSILQGFTIRNGISVDGGGIYCSFSSPTIIGNTISKNMAVNNGGGIYGYYSNPTITGNTITENTSAVWAGGIGIWWPNYGITTVTGNTISENRSLQCGGIGVDRQTATIEDNIISGNTTTGPYGGGLSLTRGMFTVSNNVITNNAVDSIGGGILIYGSSATINNNTLTENNAVSAGGGIWVADDCMVNITNTIFWNNDAVAGPEIYIGYLDLYIPSTLTISYSDVEGGQEAVYVDEGCILNWGDGMIDEDPMFVLPDKHDCRLLWQSPCIDTGNPTLFDPDGTRSEMGAHYFNQDDFLTLYLTPDASEVLPGDQFGITYTVINRWAQPEPFWVLSQVLLPGGSALNILGPDPYTLPANYTAQVYISHPVPNMTPAGVYEYRSLIGIPPGTLYDIDSFKFRVGE